MKDFSVIIYAVLALLLTVGAGSMNAQSPEMVEMFVAPAKLWSNWSDDYTLVVSVKRWNGSDADEGNWANFEFAPISTTYDGTRVYKGEIEIIYGGFAQMVFTAKDHEGDYEYTFWPPETTDGHWMEKADFASKIFISWNKDDGIRNFLNYSDSRYRLYVLNDNKWDNVYLRIGHDTYSDVYPFSRINGTNWWYCNAPDWCTMTYFTITDNNQNAGEGHGVGDFADGTNRLYENNYSISQDHWYTIGDGPSATGNHYWWSMDDQTYFTGATISSEAGHRVYFDNSASQWEHVYLRIGRTKATGFGSYVSSWPMTRIDGTDLWFVETEDWANAEAWTITDTDANSGDDMSTYDLPFSANRLYFYTTSINEDIFYTATGNAPQGTDNGQYWDNFRSEIYTRNVTAGNYGTICLPKAATLYTGATMFRVADRAAGNGIVIEEVDAMNAGEPYIFCATDSKLLATLTGDARSAGSANGLVGHIGEALTLNSDGNDLFILAQNKLWMVDVDVTIPSNRAYIDMRDIVSMAPAPGRQRRVIAGTDAATAIENGTQQPCMRGQKTLRDGQLLLIRDGVKYNAQGQMIK